MTRRSSRATKKLEVVEIPNIARRAIGLVDLELKKTILEAADLVGVDMNDGWQLTPDGSRFVRTAVAGKPKSSDNKAKKGTPAKGK